MSQIDNQPLRYWNGNAIYLTAYLTMGLMGGFLLVLLAGGMGLPPSLLGFTPALFLHGAVWQPLTYVFVDQVTIWVMIGFVAFYFWGTEVERYLGRRFLLTLCGISLAIPVVCHLALAPVVSTPILYGSYQVVAAVLVAYACLYPSLGVLGGILPLMWFAIVLLGFQAAVYINSHMWADLLALSVVCAVSIGLVRNAGAVHDWKWSYHPGQWFKRKPRFRVMPSPSERSSDPTPSSASRGGGRAFSSIAAPSAAEIELDALLDKIARSGLASLSEAERERLEKARQEMLKKGS